MSLEHKQAQMRERIRQPLVYKTANGLRAHPRRPQLPETRPFARGHIYLIGNHTHGWYKIGLSHEDSIENRLCAFRNLPFGIDLEKTWLCDRVTWAERALHNLFASRRIAGEWFQFNPSELARVQTVIAQTVRGEIVTKW